MAKFIIKDGSFVNRENGETVSSISGKLAKIESFTDENTNVPKLRYSFAPAVEGAEGDSFSVRRYGDASLKILRCLFGITDIIADKVICISLVAREGQKAAIEITADGEQLTPLGSVGPYASEKNIFTDRLSAALAHALNFNFPVLYVEFPGGFMPETFEEGLEKIKALRLAGDTDGLVVKKTSFTNKHAYDAYLQACRDFGHGQTFTDDIDISEIEDEMSAPLGAAEGEGATTEDPDPDGEV